MPARQPLPMLWLLSDARNDAELERVLIELPQGSAFVFRHYHLEAGARRARFNALCGLAQAYGHVVILSDNAGTAQKWGADGVYGEAERLGPQGALLRLATAHNSEELQAAEQAGVDGIFLSPVFPTRSHPGGETLGPLGFHVLAQQTSLPVIALGGMNPARAEELDWPRWGAIDGLV
ncbi:thiamine phosphate synthase [Qipengyuania sp. DGS5-3]|uniref:thiamine phosphate synthase n=1 Tax=Qipengyuania sp. DGS5-3 TaxID=3349632 RepID=UPI0036D2EB7C